MKANELDKKFDNGEDVLEHFDISSSSRPNLEIKRVNIDFPAWMVESLDKESSRLGVARQSLVKMWISQRLDKRNISKDPQ